MQTFQIHPKLGLTALDTADTEITSTDSCFYWINLAHSDFQDNFEQCLGRIESLCKQKVDRDHIFSLLNNTHTSFFENTPTFEMLFLRILSFPKDWPTEPLAFSQKLLSSDQEGVPLSFLSCLSFPNLIVTSHPDLDGCINDFITLLKSFTDHSIVQIDLNLNEVGKIHTSSLFRLPYNVSEFRTFLLTALINRYQTIRLPLTLILDQQQRDLLMSYQPTFGWKSMLEARITLRYIESICEEQISCLDDILSLTSDMQNKNHSTHKTLPSYHQGVSRVIDHIERIHTHVTRMEAAIETVVQIHFSATSNHTNEVMRIMTVVMMLFLPLTVLSGLFGMNFANMPLINNPYGFWYIISIVSGVFISFFTWYLTRKLRYKKPKLDINLLHARLKRLRSSTSSNPKHPT